MWNSFSFHGGWTVGVFFFHPYTLPPPPTFINEPSLSALVHKVLPPPFLGGWGEVSEFSSSQVLFWPPCLWPTNQWKSRPIAGQLTNYFLLYVGSENPMYERGPDNQLIIRSRGSSTSSRLFQSIDETAQLGSQVFLQSNHSRPPSVAHGLYQSLSPRTMSISSGEQGRLSLEPDEQDVLPYQKLLAMKKSPADDGDKTEGHVTGCRAATTCDQNMYQSLKKTPQSQVRRK